MCGIAGVISKYNNGFFKQTEDCFYQMLYADALRGEDSTGLIAIERDGKFHIAKEASSADWFIQAFRSDDSKVAQDMYQRGKAFIGHNRKKTMGRVEDVTAHPFLVKDKFALVHNGTLNTHKHMADTEVDSEALAIHLQKAIEAGHGELRKIKENLEEALADVHGAYACAMYDQEFHRVYLLRNKERPLSVIETDNAWYFMSEALMGYWILARNGYATEKLKAEIVYEHDLWCFDLDTSKVSKEHLTPKKRWTLPFQAPTGQTGAPWVSLQEIGTTKLQAPTGAGVSKVTGKFIQEEKDLKRIRKNFLGKRISFWVDDYIEKNFPATIAKGETEVTIMGGLDELVWAHNIYACVDLSQLGLRFEEDILNRKWTGVIETISVSNGYLRLELQDGCKPMVESKPTNTTTEVKLWKADIQKKTTEELQVLHEAVKFDNTNPWKVTEINREFAFRSSIHSIGEAVKRANSMEPGNELKQVERDGKMIFITEGPEGRIYYETAIVVH